MNNRRSERSTTKGWIYVSTTISSRARLVSLTDRRQPRVKGQHGSVPVPDTTKYTSAGTIWLCSVHRQRLMGSSLISEELILQQIGYSIACPTCQTIRQPKANQLWFIINKLINLSRMLPTLMADLDKSDWINNHFLWLSKLVPFAVTNEAPESYPSHTLQEIDGHKKSLASLQWRRCMAKYNIGVHSEKELHSVSEWTSALRK